MVVVRREVGAARQGGEGRRRFARTTQVHKGARRCGDPTGWAMGGGPLGWLEGGRRVAPIGWRPCRERRRSCTAPGRRTPLSVASLAYVRTCLAAACARP